jgi:hypothetical protein
MQAAGRHAFELADHAIEFFNQWVASGFAKFLNEGAVIPEGAFLSTGKAIKHGVALHANFIQGLPHIRKLVGGADHTHLVRLACKSFEVGSLSIHPRRFRLEVAVRAAIHDVRDAFPEFSLYFAQPWPTALIFYRVMQQSRNRHFFIAAILYHQGSNAKQVADVRPLGALANLAPVQTSSVGEGLSKLIRKDSGWKPFGDRTRSLALAHLAEQAQNFQVEPYQRDHQAKSSVPFHVLWSTHACGIFDHVKIEN